MTESKKVSGWQEMVEILDFEGVSRTPTYSGFGLEIYQNLDKQMQIIYNCHGDNNEVIIRRNF